MDNPFVTVVIPVYNVEKYLHRCISSVTSQTYANMEIILVDDGSTDLSGRICDEWKEKDSRISVIHKENAGLGMARNTGIDHASGKYIFFFDSDDYVETSTVEKCVENAEKNQSDTVIFGQYDVYPDGNVVSIRTDLPQSVFESKEITETLLPEMLCFRRGYDISACMKMFSLDIIRSHNIRFFSERDIISEDAFFCLDYFAAAKKVSVLPDNLYYYYKNEKSLSRNFVPDRQKKNDIFLLKAEEKIRDLQLSDTVLPYLRLKYQIYSLAALKHLIVADIPQTAKKSEIREIYRDQYLQKTINIAVLRISSLPMAVFMLCMKLKLYFLCDILLKCKV